MSALYLHDLNVKEDPPRTQLLALFFGHCIEGANYAVMETGNLHLVLQLLVDVLQGFHCWDNFVNREVDLKKDFDKLGEGGAKAEEILRVTLLA